MIKSLDFFIFSVSLAAIKEATKQASLKSIFEKLCL